MKICLCANRFPPNVVGGAEVVVHDLAVTLRDRGHQVSILTLSDTRVGTRTVVDDLDVHIMPNLNLYNQFAPAKRSWVKKALFGVVDTLNPFMFLLVWRQLKSLGVDVLCTNNIKGMGPAVWLAARVLRVPVVHVMHDYWLVCPASTRFRNGNACNGACNGCRRISAPKARLSRLVDHAVAVSGFVMARHREQDFFSAAEQTVIHNSTPSISTEGVEPTKAHTSFRVGFIGRVDETKGIREFFASVAEAAKVVPAIEIHIAGRDHDGMLPELIREHPGLTFVHHGFISAAAFYQDIDLVVVTSMWDEPFGVVAIEPWAFFKPSIAFASGGLAEVFDALPELIVPRGDCKALGALIARLASDEAWYLDIARRCHGRLAEFTQARQVRQFERVLLSTIANHDRHDSMSRRKGPPRDA
ncbi:glycosyltransferase [Burkholderia sp. Bp8998]|uniref:glycosyltransferase n=1 Tax=Burkholderia sp. Bp8998 TaxID=2184557 RepID=UPI000F5AB791|nr:glycosyltransferase [Burkholderia sp. Bp8998]RQS23228.1 glycosyltransferase [Burkholderia sp. Bp8998]